MHVVIRKFGAIFPKIYHRNNPLWCNCDIQSHNRARARVCVCVLLVLSGSYHLLSMLFEDYILYLLEREIQSQKEASLQAAIGDYFTVMPGNVPACL